MTAHILQYPGFAWTIYEHRQFVDWQAGLGPNAQFFRITRKQAAESILLVRKTYCKQLEAKNASIRA